MFAVGLLLVRMLCDLFKPRPRLEAEILILRHQLNVLRQRTPRRRLHLRWIDRALFIWLYRRYPRILDALSIVRPETVVRWHRKGFTGYWRWKSRSPGGRPRIAREVRELIRRMSFENSLWGATKIHGELLKLGIAVAQSTVSIYMVPRRDRPLQTWETFLRNHMEGIASIDLFVVPTIAFQQLFAFLVLGHKRRQLLWFAVTRNPTAEWLARHECTDHVIVFNEDHLRRILSNYASYYNEVRTHLSLGKDAPYTRPIERFGDIIAQPILGGLHHRYARI